MNAAQQTNAWLLNYIFDFTCRAVCGEETGKMQKAYTPIRIALQFIYIYSRQN